jgi:hypothetical protein
VLLAAGVLVAAVALHLRDPHVEDSWGFCPWRLITGTSCPGCGGLRAVNDLTHGDVAAAASSNLLLVAAPPVVAGLWLRSMRQRWTGVRRAFPRTATSAAVGVAAVAVAGFWVLRNLPAGSWLAP